MKTPANPENVPLDKIPAGWRLIYEEEYGKYTTPCKVWLKRIETFSTGIDPSPQIKDFTLITPDLPDNGQPWHAHKPGDPAPVEDGVGVDLVLRDGQIVDNAWAPKWGNDIAATKEILFYRLHDPAPMKTASPTFEAHGHTWFRHTPGDPCPCDKDALVHWINANDLDGDYYHQAAKAEDIGWTRQVGWRYANPEQPAKPSTPPTSERILSILIAAGHITEEQVEQARKLVKP